MITDEMVLKYLAQAGNVCLYCGSKEINAMGMDVDGNVGVEVVECETCGRSWRDICNVTLAGVSEREDYVKVKLSSGADIEVMNEDEAKSLVVDTYPDAFFGEWQPDMPGMERMLVWECEEAAGPEGTGDDGSHAVAEITRAVK